VDSSHSELITRQNSSIELEPKVRVRVYQKIHCDDFIVRLFRCVTSSLRV